MQAAHHASLEVLCEEKGYAPIRTWFLEVGTSTDGIWTVVAKPRLHQHEGDMDQERVDGSALHFAFLARIVDGTASRKQVCNSWKKVLNVGRIQCHLQRPKF